MSTWTTIFTVVGAVLAVWSMSWIVRAQREGSNDRKLETVARARVASGEGWDGPAPPRAFSDEELAALSRALEPMSLEEAGVIARPIEPMPSRLQRLQRRASRSRS